MNITEQTVAQWLDVGVRVGLSAVMVLGFVAIIWLVLTRQVRRRQENIQSQISNIGHSLTRCKHRLAEIEKEAADYPKTDPLPYQSLAFDLHQIVESTKSQQTALLTRFETLAAEELPFPNHFLVWLTADFWQRPRYWAQREQAFTALSVEIEALQSELNRASALLQALGEMPRTVAEQVRELLEATDRSLSIGRSLRRAKVHGDQLDSATAEVERLSGKLKSLPTSAMYGGVRLALADLKQQVITAWRVVQTLTGPVEKYQRSFEIWQADYQTIEQRVEAMSEALKEVVAWLKQTPASVKIESIMETVQDAHKLYQSLSKIFLALTLEIFADFNESVLQVTQTFKEVSKQIEHIQKQFQTLGELLKSNASLLEQLETWMKVTRQDSRYPMAWGQYDNDFTALCGLQRRVGSLAAERTPEQLDKSVRQAWLLVTAAEGLIVKVEAACSTRQELLPLLEHEDMKAKPAWLLQADALYQEAKPYHYTNWPVAQSVNKIIKQAKGLVKRRQTWVPSEPGDSLAAVQVKNVLDNVKKLLADVETFKRNSQQFAEVFAKLQAAEQTTLAQLDETYQLLVDLQQQMTRTEWPLSQEFDKDRSNLEKLGEHNRKLEASLQKKKHISAVSDKVREVEKWLVTCRKALQRWPDRLQAEIKSIGAELKNQAAALPVEIFSAQKNLRQLLLINRPTALPAPNKKKINSEFDKIKYFADQIKAQFKDREVLYATLNQVKAQLDELEQSGQVLG